jgi:hypothetical protein
MGIGRPKNSQEEHLLQELNNKKGYLKICMEDISNILFVIHFKRVVLAKMLRFFFFEKKSCSIYYIEL